MPTALSQQQLLYNISHPPPANYIKILFNFRQRCLVTLGVLPKQGHKLPHSVPPAPSLPSKRRLRAPRREVKHLSQRSLYSEGTSCTNTALAPTEKGQPHCAVPDKARGLQGAPGCPRLRAPGEPRPPKPQKARPCSLSRRSESPNPGARGAQYHSYFPKLPR